VSNAGTSFCWITGTSTGAIKPGAGIIDCANSCGTAGQVLMSNGSNAICWGTAGGGATLATEAESKAGTLATVASTPAFTVPKNAAGMTGAAIIPNGTTGQQPAGAAGFARINNTLGQLTFFASGAYFPIGFGPGGNTSNTAAGLNALASNNAFGIDNTAYGFNSLCSNTGGSANTAVGLNSLRSNTSATYNTAVGFNSMLTNSTGSYNTAYGSNALQQNTTGNNNTAHGSGALLSGNGSNNTAVGLSALTANSGSNNTALGSRALQGVTSGINNLALGANSGSDALCSLSTQSNFVILGNNTTACVISKVPVTVPSDVRWKKIAGEVPLALPFVNSLNPIKYQYCDAATGEVTDDRYRYGFCAQEILANEENPQHPVIIGIDNEEMYSLNETQLLPVLVNAVKELSSRVDSLQTELNTLKANG
jgi:hypothetical protein